MLKSPPEYRRDEYAGTDLDVYGCWVTIIALAIGAGIGAAIAMYILYGV